MGFSSLLVAMLLYNVFVCLSVLWFLGKLNFTIEKWIPMIISSEATDCLTVGELVYDYYMSVCSLIRSVARKF